jgi:hypothetical protein
MDSTTTKISRRKISPTMPQFEFNWLMKLLRYQRSAWWHTQKNQKCIIDSLLKPQKVHGVLSSQLNS